ncbi:MAG: hypothetical protein ACE5OR_01085 [bacterium]
MPIVDGRYEVKISTTFRSVKEAVEEMKKKIERSRKVRINNIPMQLLEKFEPLLEGKDVKIILPPDERPTAQLKRLGDVAVTKARIYKDFKGIEAEAGGLYFSDRVYNVVWTKDKILEVDTLEYGKCVKCMRDMFETGWRYSEK